MTWKKYMSALLCWVCCLGISHAQDYKVVYKTAQCKRLDTGKALALGETLKAGDKVELGKASGKLILWNKATGLTMMASRKLESGKWQTSGPVGELQQALPAVATHSEQIASMEDLQAHFAGRNYLILEKTWLLAAPQFTLDGDTVLFYKFECPLANLQVNRKVEHSGDSLLLTPELILDMNGKPVPANDASGFQLHWLDLKTKGYKQLARFEFVFPDEVALTAEVSALLSALQADGVDKQAILPTVHQFLVASYGDPDLHNLKNWLASRFPEVQ